jgi:hypothetical protein
MTEVLREPTGLAYDFARTAEELERLSEQARAELRQPDIVIPQIDGMDLAAYTEAFVRANFDQMVGYILKMANRVALTGESNVGVVIQAPIELGAAPHLHDLGVAIIGYFNNSGFTACGLEQGRSIVSDEHFDPETGKTTYFDATLVRLFWPE